MTDELVLRPPSPYEFGMIGEALTVAAEVCGDDSSKFVSIASASPDIGRVIETLASASIWLTAWGGIVAEARSRLLAAAPGGAA